MTRHPRRGLGDADDVHEEPSRCCGTRSPSRPPSAGTRVTSARTRSSGASSRSSTTSTTRSIPRSTSIHRTARRSSARRAIRRRSSRASSRTPSTWRCRATRQLKKTLFACDELSGFVHGVRLRAARRDRDAGAEVGAQEAEAAFVCRRRAPRRGLPRRRGARPRARRAHRATSSRRCGRSPASSG